MTIRAGPHVGILVFDDADELDVVGPFAVLTRWMRLSALQPTVATFSHDGNGVRLDHGLGLVPDAATPELDGLHLLIHPGGSGAEALTADADHLEWLRTVHATTQVIAGLGAGVATLAASGLLAWRPATTHPDAYDDVYAADPSVVIERGARFVDDGDIATAGGVTGSIDLALHLVARFETPAVAHAVRTVIAHDSAADLDDGL